MDLHRYLTKGVRLDRETDERKLHLLIPRVKRESYYQTLLENLLNSEHHYLGGAGITDLTLNNAHVEIKEGRKYNQTCGQLLKYHLARPRKYLVAVLFGPLPDRDFLCLFFSHTCVTHVLHFDAADN